MKQIAGLEMVAAGIEGLANESKKRNEIAVKLLELETKNSRMSLFNMEGTSPAVRRKFLEIEQKRILAEMEAEQEVIEAARKKPRREEPPSTGGSNEHLQVHEVQTETLIDDSEEDIVASAILSIS